MDYPPTSFDRGVATGDALGVALGVALGADSSRIGSSRNTSVSRWAVPLGSSET
jgi:hypothetical protein